MRVATVVQQYCKSCRTCFMFYCMFYFTCDRSLRCRSVLGPKCPEPDHTTSVIDLQFSHMQLPMHDAVIRGSMAASLQTANHSITWDFHRRHPASSQPVRCMVSPARTAYSCPIRGMPGPRAVFIPNLMSLKAC